MFFTFLGQKMRSENELFWSILVVTKRSLVNCTWASDTSTGTLTGLVEDVVVPGVVGSGARCGPWCTPVYTVRVWTQTNTVKTLLKHGNRQNTELSQNTEIVQSDSQTRKSVNQTVRHEPQTTKTVRHQTVTSETSDTKLQECQQSDTKKHQACQQPDTKNVAVNTKTGHNQVTPRSLDISCFRCFSGVIVVALVSS